MGWLQNAPRGIKKFGALLSVPGDSLNRFGTFDGALPEVGDFVAHEDEAFEVVRRIFISGGRQLGPHYLDVELIVVRGDPDMLREGVLET